MHDFSYLIEKIVASEPSTSPFKHVYIEDFFSDEHFAELIASEEIAAPDAGHDEELIQGLYRKGFKAIPFPGCITDKTKYIDWHSGGKRAKHHSAFEGFGMTLRLYDPSTPILDAINKYLSSNLFNRAVAERFGLDIENCTFDGGIQKYLDGYEISPHPDVRRKAATFMVNINPNDLSESADHHMHYLQFKPERQYVQAFWEGNPTIERAWVPWAWTDTVYQQTKNNSIVLFSPSDDTMHGVKANYDHLRTQRTQLYGNLWYSKNPASAKIEWEDLDLIGRAETQGRIKRLAMAMLPASAIKLLKRVRNSEKNVGRRNY